MISLQENDVVGMALPSIREKYGEEETKRLIDGCRKVNSTAELPKDLHDMMEYGINATDYTTGQPKKKAVAKTYNQARGLF